MSIGAVSSISSYAGAGIIGAALEANLAALENKLHRSQFERIIAESTKGKPPMSRAKLAVSVLQYLRSVQTLPLGNAVLKTSDLHLHLKASNCREIERFIRFSTVFRELRQMKIAAFLTEPVQARVKAMYAEFLAKNDFDSIALLNYSLFAGSQILGGHAWQPLSSDPLKFIDNLKIVTDWLASKETQVKEYYALADAGNTHRLERDRYSDDRIKRSGEPPLPRYAYHTYANIPADKLLRLEHGGGIYCLADIWARTSSGYGLLNGGYGLQVHPLDPAPAEGSRIPTAVNPERVKYYADYAPRYYFDRPCALTGTIPACFLDTANEMGFDSTGKRVSRTSRLYEAGVRTENVDHISDIGIQFL